MFLFVFLLLFGRVTSYLVVHVLFFLLMFFYKNKVKNGEEIAKVVKSLIEGEEGKKLRNRMKDLKEAAAQALSPNGASTKALSDVADKWKNKTCN